MPSHEATAVIAAAGSGSRLGAGGPKALVEVAGRPLIAWCLDAFAAARSVGAVVIAAPPSHQEALAEIAPDATVVSGGETRARSVAAGLDRVATELVAVHDAARPLVTAELVDGLVARLAASPDAAGVIAATPITDTLKRSGANPATIEETIDRGGLWAAQTPQVFRTAALRAAHERDPAGAAAASDDAMLIEAAGGTVLIEETPRANLKVTTRDDLLLAAALLGGRR